MKWSDEEELMQRLRLLGKQGYPRQGYAEKLRVRLQQEINRQRRRRRHFQVAMMTGMTVASFFLAFQLLTPPSPFQPWVWKEDRTVLLEEKRALMADKRKFEQNKLVEPPEPPPTQVTDQRKRDQSERARPPEIPRKESKAPPITPPSPGPNQQSIEELNPVNPPLENVQTVDPIQKEVSAYLGKLLEQDSHEYRPLEEMTDKNRGKLVYARTINGVPFLGESVTVVVDESGTVTGAQITSNQYSVPIEQFPDPKTAMSKAEAEKLIANAMQLEYKVRAGDGNPELVYRIPSNRNLHANTGKWIDGDGFHEVEGRVIDVSPKGMPLDVAELDQMLLLGKGQITGQSDSYEEDELKAAVMALETYLPSHVTQLRLKRVTKDEADLLFFFTWLHQGIPVIDRNYVIAIDADHLKPVGISGVFEKAPPMLPDKNNAISPEDALRIYTGQYPLTLVYIPSAEEQQDYSPILSYTFLKQENYISTINAITSVLEP